MTTELSKLSQTERAAGEETATAWETFFYGLRKDSIERAEEIRETARITEVQDKHQAELLALEHVVGVAPSLKMTGEKPTKTWSMTILVEKKLPLGKLPKDARVPKEMAGVTTDVVEVGKLEAFVFNARVRPALPGYSIGHHNITAGTFGCLVQDIRRCSCKFEKSDCRTPTGDDCPGDYLILSNNHVLADAIARQAELLALEHVVGVAPSLKMTGEKPTKTWSMTILVEKKLPLGKLPKDARVPKEMAGVTTDVVEVGKLEAFVFNARVRPALPGYSIGHHNITAGTFGCLVQDIRRCSCKFEKSDCRTPTGDDCPGDYLILSNNHVLGIRLSRRNCR